MRWGPDMAAEMFERLDEFENNPEERVLVLTGTEPSFCSGANVRGFRRRIDEREAEEEPEPLTWGKMEYMKGRQSRVESGPRVNFVAPANPRFAKNHPSRWSTALPPGSVAGWPCPVTSGLSGKPAGSRNALC